MAKIDTSEFQVLGNNQNALFSLKVSRGEGMLLLAMNWKNENLPIDFVGFSIEYKEPDGDKFFALKNRLSFLDKNGKPSPVSISSLQAPFQMFRWVHFPRNANLKGKFTYMVKPVFMNINDELSYGENQTVEIALNRETYPDQLNVSFTRGFVSSQAFVDKYEKDGGIASLLPPKAALGLDFKPTHPKSDEALSWMGFEAVKEILDLLDEADKDKSAKIMVVAYDLNHPEIVKRLVKLGNRLKVIIDNSGDHGEEHSSETKAEKQLQESTGGNVKRHHMNQLQHNKTIIVKGAKVNAAICGSTNFSWRGFYVQSNNAIIVRGEKTIQPFLDAFDNYWKYDDAKNFGQTKSAEWSDLQLAGIDAKVSFSPHASKNALLDKIAKDMSHANSSVFYSLAFLFSVQGSIRETVKKLTEDDKIFVYGVSDKKVGGLDLLKPDGNLAPVFPSELSKNLPEPFKSEPSGGFGARMHHKFIVIDFDKPTARVYLGSYNFSGTADTKNGENLLLIRDRKIAVSYMIEALRIFDHYHFRVLQKESKKDGKPLCLAKPPKIATEKTWWERYYTDPKKIRDRKLFS